MPAKVHLAIVLKMKTTCLDPPVKLLPSLLLASVMCSSAISH